MSWIMIIIVSAAGAALFDYLVDQHNPQHTWYAGLAVGLLVGIIAITIKHGYF